MNLLYLNVFLRYLPGIGMYLAVVFGSKGSEGFQTARDSAFVFSTGLFSVLI